MRLRLLLEKRQGFAGTRRERFEPSRSGSFVPGTFAEMAAQAAAQSYLDRRPDLERVVIKDADTGETIRIIGREEQ